jgi:hypothetical protein
MDIPEGAPEATATGEEEEEEEAEEAEVATALVLESVRLQTTGIISALLSDSFDKRLCCWLHLKSIFCLLLVVVVELVAKTRDCWPALMSIIPETAVHSSTTADAIFAPSSCPKASCQGEKKTMAPAAGTHRSPGSRTIKSRHTDCRSVQKNHSSRKTEERARERERERSRTSTREVSYCKSRISRHIWRGKKLTCRHIHYSQSLFTASPESLAIFRGGKKITCRHIHYSQSLFTASPESLAIFRGGKKLTCRHIHYSQSLFTASPESLAIFRGKKAHMSPYLLHTILIYFESSISRHIWSFKKTHIFAMFTTHDPYLLRVQNLLPYLEGGKIKSNVAIFTTHRPFAS